MQPGLYEEGDWPQVEGIIQKVDAEFGTMAQLFKPGVVRMDARQCHEFAATKSPGVYIFIHEEHGRSKVGKHFLNVSKRALEHCTDNTSSLDKSIQMKHLRDNDKTYMLIFALHEREALHWVLALECFLEKNLTPKICSRRNG